MVMSSPPSSSEDHKQNIAMGYPSMDRYHQAQYMIPLQTPPVVYPIPGRPQRHTSSLEPNTFPPPYATSSPNHNVPQPYVAASSYHFPISPTLSPYQADPKYFTSTSQKLYAQQPHNDFYYPQQHYNPLVLEPNHRSSFGRVMLILMIVLVASMCMMTVVVWFLFGTYVPEFEVASLKVSNFTATNTTLTGEWDVDISVGNPNKDLAINFDHVMSSIFYKDSLLGISAVGDFQVPQMQRTKLNFSLTTEQATAEGNKLQSWVLPTLAHDHSNGVVAFSLRLAVKANFTTPTMVYMQENMRVYCENMHVMFSVSTGEGLLTPGLGNTCLIRIHDGLKGY